MDVTVYPPPPQSLSASDRTRLGQRSYPDPAFGINKTLLKAFLCRKRHFCSSDFALTNRVCLAEAVTDCE
ncbi:hypothetical protein XENOCAPTIV_025694 [Xenoophorus captivus]|uniref:Uncharacterized protein n=1 Tax=Xenoophorus captivus TaxID=1517983 RepID=A0ABV0SCJ5_9TELE